MDREQEEIQFLGFFGILKESFNIVSSWRKIFAQITLTLVIPLSFVYLAHVLIAELLFADIKQNELVRDISPEGSSSHIKGSKIVASEWTKFVLFKIGMELFFSILLLLSTAAVVYSIACIYTAREITLKKIMSVVPKVWKRLMMTYIWNFIIMIVYNVVCILVLVLGVVVYGLVRNLSILFIVFAILFAVVYMIGLVYITIIWHLAAVVSVLEESYGLKAMTKSRSLIKGKMGVAVAVLFLVGFFFFGIEIMFEFLVVVEDEIAKRIGFGVLCLILMSISMLLGLVTQTIIYFVCKSYHHENIDKSSLSEHLGGFLGYVRLKSNDVQLEHIEV